MGVDYAGPFAKVLTGFGFKESVDAVYENITVEETEDGSIIINKANGKTWNAGILKIVNITEIPKQRSKGWW